MFENYVRLPMAGFMKLSAGMMILWDRMSVKNYRPDVKQLCFAQFG
jgi:hypothetical protein